MSWNANRFSSYGESYRTIRESDSTHHRKPKSLGGDSSERNLTELPRSKHAAWHTLFRNFTPERIAQEINERYLDPNYRFVVVPVGQDTKE